MQNYFTDFPLEKVVEIASYLTTEQDKSRFALCCHQFYACSQETRLVNKLLLCIISGNQEKAEKLLKMNPQLAAHKGTITDWSGRKFSSISPFEYALWALDVRYMVNMMLDCLPEDERGEAIRIKLLKQAQDIKEHGLAYTQNGARYQERYFNLGPLKEALKANTEFFDAIDVNDSSREEEATKGLEKLWFEVGRLQNNLPAHIRQHYCQSLVLGTEQTGTEEHFERSLTFYNYTRSAQEEWDNQLTGLGETFAIAAGGQPRGTAYATSELSFPDYLFLERLEKTRLADLSLLYKRLEQPIDLTPLHLFDQAQP